MRSKKTLIQTFLILTLILLNFVVFNFYYKADSKKDQTDLKNKEIEEKSLNVKNNNLIENLKYTSNNSRGDIYELFADFGEANKENPDIMFLTNVNGRIKSKNKHDVLLTSKFANFNTKTFETTFIDNVKISRHDEIITGDELYLVLDRDKNDFKENLDKEENLLRISNNVSFKKPGYSLEADIVEIDLITKNSKIYMKNGIKKVSATSVLK
tara:strand:- start:657 stop:1292 length:636 start_codon:yes stop_codon:yes gene_type:complete